MTRMRVAPDQSDQTARLSLVFFVFLLGTLAGIALAVVTDALSRTNWGGPNWSFVGNGALVVLFSGVPAVAAGGWVALALWRVFHPRWGAAALAAGLATLAAAGFAGFGPVLALALQGLDTPEAPATLEAARLTLATTFVAPIALAVVAGLLLTSVLVRLTRRGAAAELVLALLACVVALVPRGFFVWVFLLAPLLLPLMVSLPTIVTAGQVRRGPPLIGNLWLAGACVALTAGVLAGVIAAQWVQTR